MCAYGTHEKKKGDKEMLNQFVVVGRVATLGYTYLTLTVTRTKGQEIDTLHIDLPVSIADSVLKAELKEGDLIGIKGMIESSNNLRAEKVTFLSSQNREEVEDNGN